MQTKTVEKVIKGSLLYSIALTQPIATSQVLAAPSSDISVFEQKELQYGDHGELVRHVQLKLKKLNYYNDEIDGVYGLYTEHAVRSFQSSETISIDGIINEETFTTLLSSEKKAAFEQIQSEIDTISYGDQNEAVTKVQEVLYFYGYYRGNIDGIYGPLTEDAIEQVLKEELIPPPEKELNQVVNETEELTEVDEPQYTEAETKVNDINEQEKTDSTNAIPLEVSNNTNHIISRAKSLIGTPYVWGGTAPGGFDCSGFIQFVYQENNIVIPRTVNEIWNFSSKVNSPSIGDLVFFETYQPGPSHMGIYLGAGNFIHAGSSRGVEISNLDNNSYWKTRYLGAKRIQ